MVPCCPCVSVRRNQGRLTKSLNESTHLFLRQNAVECRYKVAHGSLTVASYHIIDSLDISLVQTNFVQFHDAKIQLLFELGTIL